MKIKKIINFFFYIQILCLFIFFKVYAENFNYQLEAKKIRYINEKNIIIAEGDAIAKDNFGKKIFSDFIIYDKKNLIIKTNKNSIYIDDKGNKIFADNFYYDLKLKKISAKINVKYTEKNGSEFYFSEFEFYENSQKAYGKNMQGTLSDKSSIDGPIVEIDNNNSTIIVTNNLENNNFFNLSQNHYTTCINKNNSKKKINDRCPDWSLSTSKTRHDSVKKMVYHNNAFIKIKNIPVFYTPYFSHPDPSVKRKSGFLTPSTKNFSNLGRTIKIPYFWSLNEDSDITFTPILYQDENSIFLTEYRKQNKNSLLAIDTSYSKGYKDLNKRGENGENLNRTSGSRNHFFLKFLGSYNDIFLQNNDLEINIQRISQKNYLNVNQINTEYLKQDISSLNNNITLNSYIDNQRLKLSMNVYENLSNDDSNTKYQYTIPTIEYNNFFNKFDQNINVNNYFDLKNYDGDTKQSTQINKIETTSLAKIIKKIGLSNIFKTKITNINVYNDNVINTKENFNSDLITTIALESSLPMVKFNETKTEELLTPKLFAKYTTGSMTNSSSESKIISYEDVYSMDRMSNLINPETGKSIGYGMEYEINKKNNENLVYLINKFSIGQIINTEEIQELPTTSSLNKKSSNIVGNYNFYYSKNSNATTKKIDEFKGKEIKNGLNLNYNFNISNDINKILKNEIELSYENEKNTFYANYYETHDIGNQNYIESKYKRKLTENHNFIIGARKNLEESYSENNFIEFNYDSDCLKIGINLAKSFYQNEDIKSDNNLTLFVMLKPFGQPIAPDLTNLINN